MNQMKDEKVNTDGVIAEEDLEAAAGGATQNRYNPDVCGKYTKVEYECVGFLKKIRCDHYKEESLNLIRTRYHYTCVMGRYDYIGDGHGDPRE